MPSPEQKFQAAHSTFLVQWANGLHPLEIAQLLGLSKSQVAKHSLAAYREKAPRTEPDYECLTWQELPEALKKLMPSEEDNGLVKVTTTGDALLLELIAKRK